MNRRRILVVEDEILIAKLIMYRLESFGYEPLGPVMEGEIAVQEAIRKRPALVLMDIKLRGQLDGFEAARRIWDEAGIPSLFLSAFGEAYAEAIRGFPGGLGFIVKPFEDEELRHGLASAFSEEN